MQMYASKKAKTWVHSFDGVNVTVGGSKAEMALKLGVSS